MKTAFLNGDLNEGNTIGLLTRKSIYGIKQSPRMWNENISLFLLKLGFIRSIKNNGLYILQKREIFVWLALYVDD